MGVSVRAGLMFPSAKSSRDIGAQWFAVGLDYKMGDLRFGQTGNERSMQWSLSLDYYGKGDSSCVPILVNIVQRNEAVYYFGGIGIGFARVPISSVEIANRTKLCYGFGVGYDFQTGPTPLFVEGRWFGCSESKLNGLGLMIGARF